MDSHSTSSSPGLLLVTMRPHASPASRARFRDWYNNEHGPDRLRLPDIFANGLRYRSLSLSDDEKDSTDLFMALYDVPLMHRLAEPAYTSLRARRSPREAEIIAADVDDLRRDLFDLVWTSQVSFFVPLEKLADDEAHAIVTVAEQVTPSEGDDYRAWFVDEHVPTLAQGAGWLRSRLFKTSSLGQQETVVYLGLHDYAKHKGDTPSTDMARRIDVLAENRRTWSLFYVFGPAPRDLGAVSLNPDPAAFTSPDGRTSTVRSPSPVISSYITTKDSLTIPYRLQGNPAPDAPVVAFSNSLLTSLHMWDPLVDLLKQKRPDLRILRYDTRGRHPIPQPPHAATFATLTADLLQLLDSLHIPRLYALVGVSVGGATALSFAINHPTRLRKFIACDFNSASTPANTQAWQDRVPSPAGSTPPAWKRPISSSG
ncbi:alpha/beta hydrolase fold domain-containing protein [Hirsutella rhossiliensis]|uniref:Alpha/beta hydrolase fold domain-containing protein n=1 Tax=Hirsutella rhossiliensis TaxID=111463 RepID=A0A9P8N3W4_9HYPO|nr:alpha/beta hydrolase fold domain-containing protein [Hirsutella rhossiliensis]KAH0966370.1 alpha/beta hydrolase fold domain-containing protein [Hirsutella rhossiliensis]